MPSVSIPSNRKFPLRKIFLRNFKSVKDSEVTISPLTVVVGANSSGKSTLLQSILSLSQAISKDLDGATYPLNGEKIRLGSFAETKSFFARDAHEPIRIGFEIETEEYFYVNNGRYNQDRVRCNYQAIVKFDLIQSGSENSGTAQVGRILIESQRKDETGSKVSLHLKARVPQEIMKIDLKFAPDLQTEDDQRESFRNYCSGSVYDSATNETHSVSKAGFSGLIPTTMWEKGDSATFTAESFVKAVTEFLKNELKEEKKRVEGKPLSDRELTEIEESGVKVLCNILSNLEEIDFGGELNEDGDVVFPHYDEDRGLWPSEFDQLTPEQKSRLAALVASSNIERIATELSRESSNLPFVLGECFKVIGGEVRKSSDELSIVTNRLFRFKTTYMAPVRLMPKVNYDPSSGRPDVGPAGEYTAYFLNSMGKKRFIFPLPNGTQERVSLNEAVNLWLEFFGLASGMKTTDNGRLGIGLRLNLLNGGQEVDLTSVGVGVSQVLPVIVSCLMAKTGTILLIEQPELHLHPKLQMDLADFFIACCKSGRQIIIETHSEHMINRLRRRIAENDNGELEKLIGVLFVEQKNGVTQYRSPSINKFGGLGADWPDGFLDIGAGEMENILGAGLAKRKKN